MQSRGETPTNSGGRSFGSRLRTGAAGAIVIGGAIFMGGAASLVTAFANTGAVSVAQNCSTYSASASLDNNVDHRLVTVSFPNTSTNVISAEYTTTGNSGKQVIWTKSGAAPASGTVTETIYNGSTAASGIEVSYHETLPAPSNCNSAISTTASDGGVIGTLIHDSATVTGTLGSPSGTVVFSLFPPSNATCSSAAGAAVFTSAPIGLTSVTPGTSHAADSGSYKTIAVGVYHWVAVYSGDSIYKGATSNCADEAVTIAKAAPSIATTASAGGAVPISVSDSATVSGGDNPTGTVVFALYPNLASCNDHSGALYTSPAEALSGGKASSGSFTLTAPGAYQWVATYSGDANNASVSSKCGDEPVSTSQAGPSIATTASSGGTVPVAVSDSATVSGGDSPTGTVVFTLYSDLASCNAGTGALYTSPAETLSGGKASSGSFTLTTAGTFQWVAKYSGDANNVGSSSKCGDEPVTSNTGGVLGITTPGTGNTSSLTGITLGGFLLLGGLGVALVGTMVPRRRRAQ